APEASGLAMRILAKAAEDGIVFMGVGEAQEYIGQQIAKMYDHDPNAGYSFDLQRIANEFLTGALRGAVSGAVTPSRRQEAVKGLYDQSEAETAHKKAE